MKQGSVQVFEASIRAWYSVEVGRLLSYFLNSIVYELVTTSEECWRRVIRKEEESFKLDLNTMAPFILFFETLPGHVDPVKGIREHVFIRRGELTILDPACGEYLVGRRA